MGEVRRSTEHDRFEIAVHGAVAGEAWFLDRDGARVFFHTAVDDAYAGQGLGRQLVAAALDATRADGLSVMPVCPYVRTVLAEDDRWADIVVTVTAEALAAVDAIARED